MNNINDIVHIVTSGGATVGVFALDSQAQEFQKLFGAPCQIESWVVSDHVTVAKLTKKDYYAPGDDVMFDDGSDRGRGIVESSTRNVYRIIHAFPPGKVVWMLPEEILGIYSESA